MLRRGRAEGPRSGRQPSPVIGTPVMVSVTENRCPPPASIGSFVVAFAHPDRMISQPATTAGADAAVINREMRIRNIGSSFFQTHGDDCRERRQDDAKHFSSGDGRILSDSGTRARTVARDFRAAPSCRGKSS